MEGFLPTITAAHALPAVMWSEEAGPGSAVMLHPLLIHQYGTSAAWLRAAIPNTAISPYSEYTHSQRAINAFQCSH